MIAELVKFRDLADDVRHFVFAAPEVERLDFQPGQFVSFSETLNGKRITRAYSIASPPGEGNRFELCLNRVPEGLFSPYLFEMRPGDSVEMKGPLGGFVLREPPSDSVFVAAGTGVAPIRSMLHHLLPLDSTHRFTLIFGVRFERRLHYHREFEDLARWHVNFDYRPTLSCSEPGWTGRTGRVQPHLLEAIGARRDLHVYVCGLRAMVDDVRGILKDLGFERRQIIYERYD